MLKIILKNKQTKKERKIGLGCYEPWFLLLIAVSSTLLDSPFLLEIELRNFLAPEFFF